MATPANASHTKVDDAQVDPNTGLPLYGMDKELYAKQQAKWTEGGGEKMQDEAREWVEAVLGIKLEGTFQEALKSGVVLCNLANTIKPGSCPKPSGMSAPFKQMENIGNYIAASEAIGVRKDDSFQTVALYENKDMLVVIRQIHQLGAAAQAAGFDGPPLGAKLADANARTFTEEQKKAAAAEPTMLGKGSHGHATQAGMFDTSKNIVKTDQQAAPTADLGMVGKGSSECASQAGTFDTSKNIVKTDQQATPTAELSKMGLGSSEGASQAGDAHGHNTIVKPQGE